jgi:hypothetical protein
MASFRDKVFSAGVRRETVQINGVDDPVVIKQLKQNESDALQAKLEKLGPGQRVAAMLAARCENPDGSPLLSAEDQVLYQSNVCADDPHVMMLVKAINKFDEDTQAIFENAKGK